MGRGGGGRLQRDGLSGDGAALAQHQVQLGSGPDPRLGRDHQVALAVDPCRHPVDPDAPSSGDHLSVVPVFQSQAVIVSQVSDENRPTTLGGVEVGKGDLGVSWSKPGRVARSASGRGTGYQNGQ